MPDAYNRASRCGGHHETADYLKSAEIPFPNRNACKPCGNTGLQTDLFEGAAPFMTPDLCHAAHAHEREWYDAPGEGTP